MKVGARNQIVGEVVEVKKGDVMCHVKLKVSAAHNMSSVMTNESLEELGVKAGDKVKVIVKAINVLVAKD